MALPIDAAAESARESGRPKGEVVLNRTLFDKSQILMHEADAGALDVPRCEAGGQVMAADTYTGDTIGMMIARHDFHKRGLARPIWSDKSADFASFDREREIGQGEGAAEALRKPFDSERWGGRRRTLKQWGPHDCARLLRPNLPVLASKIDVAAVVLPRRNHRRIRRIDHAHSGLCLHRFLTSEDAIGVVDARPRRKRVGHARGRDIIRVCLDGL